MALDAISREYIFDPETDPSEIDEVSLVYRVGNMRLDISSSY